jgi:hypothetical protein
MAGLGGIVSLLVKNAVKSAIKFELAIDPIIARFESQCPPKNELDKILQQKNQLSQAITQIETSLTSLSSTGSTIDSIVTGVKAGVTLIKALPVPSSVPPGVGIPLNVINGFSDTLDTLGILLKEFGGVTSQIAPSLQIITGTLATVNAKLATLDGLLAGCLQSETEGMTDLEKEEFFQSLGIDLSSPDNTGGSNNPNNGAEGENTDVNETLESRLSPNSNNPIVYKGFTISLDNDAGNQFSFPSRRAIGTNEEGVKIVTPFSFSSSTQVLVDAIKFQIDQTDSLELARLANEAKLQEIEIEENYELQKVQAGFREREFLKKVSTVFFGVSKRDQHKELPEIRQLYNITISAYEALKTIDPVKASNDKFLETKGITNLSSTPKKVKLSKKLKQIKDILDFANENFKTLKQKVSTVSTQATETSSSSIAGVANATSFGGGDSNLYSPIGRPGSVNGEVRFKGGKYFRYLAGSEKWVDHTPSFAPFTTKGMPGQTQVLERTGSDSDGPFKIEDTYEWNNLLYKWIFKSTKTIGNL